MDLDLSAKKRVEPNAHVLKMIDNLFTPKHKINHNTESYPCYLSIFNLQRYAYCFTSYNK
jgi:hypothetical protein